MKTNHINPSARKIIQQSLPIVSVQQWAKEIKMNNIAALARGITLIESKKSEDRTKAIQLLQACDTASKKSIRIGITGPPGVGKSSFIESFGNYVLNNSTSRIAVLSIDPSSPLQGGSILGDKTRMQSLAVQDRVYIRPSPSSGFLGHDQGGIHIRTREVIQLCEYAGYDMILVETVGVGQSSFSINDVTDFIFLLIPPGGGDELQGIKRGVTEIADIMIVNKDDSGMESLAKSTQSQYQQAAHLLPDKKIKVMRCSCLQSKGIKEIYLALHEMKIASKETKAWNKKRKVQIHKAFYNKIETTWIESLGTHRNLNSLKVLESKVSAKGNNLDLLVDRYITILKKTLWRERVKKTY